MSTVLLGAQTQSAARADAGIRRTWPAVLKLVGRPAINVPLLEEWRAHQPDGTLIYREPFEDEDLADVEGRCNRLIESVAPIRHLVDYVEAPWNEPDGENDERVDLLVRQTVRAVEILATAGLRTIIFNFPNGAPGRLEQWQRCLPALRAAKEHGGALGLHEYGRPTMQADESWLCLRFERVYKLLPGELRIDLIITEAGLDWTGRAEPNLEWGEKGFGWRAFGVTAIDYAAQIRWYVESCQRIVATGLVPRVRVVLFGLGLNDDWGSFGVDGAQEIEDLITEYSVVESTAVIIEQTRYEEWAALRAAAGEDPRDRAAFVEHIRETGGDPSQLEQYGWQPYAVGPGVLAVMAQRGRQPASDEEWFGTEISRTYDDENTPYFWDNPTGRVCVPFRAAQ